MGREIKYEWDEIKNLANQGKHGIDFEEIYDFDWDSAVISQDTRFDYNESRFGAFGMINGRLHIVIFTIREEKIRIIGLRKANARERKTYDRNSEEA